MDDEDRNGCGVDGGSPPLTRAVNLQKRSMKFRREKIDATQGMGNQTHRKAAGRQSDRSSPHSCGERRDLPPGSFAQPKSIIPTPDRRRSVGDIVYPSERQRGGDETGGPPGIRIRNVPRELIQSTIRHIGVPLATDMVSAAFHEETADGLIINRLEEIEERQGPERECVGESK